MLSAIVREANIVFKTAIQLPECLYSTAHAAIGILYITQTFLPEFNIAPMEKTHRSHIGYKHL